MSIRCMTRVWAASQAKGSALLLLLAIADHAHDDGGGAWPSQATLARKTRLTSRQVRRLMRKLEDSGELQVQKRPGRSDLLTVITREDKLSAPAEEPIAFVHATSDIAVASAPDVAAPTEDTAVSAEPSSEPSRIVLRTLASEDAAQAQRVDSKGGRGHSIGRWIDDVTRERGTPPTAAELREHQRRAVLR